MVSDGSWMLNQPTSDEIIEIFVSKSVWHANYSKLFPRARNFEVVLQWLEHGHNSPSNVDVFGVEKQFYSFKDLRDVLDKLELACMKKGKRKGRSDEGGQKKKQKVASGSKGTSE
jgi:hypothetical protein